MEIRPRERDVERDAVIGEIRRRERLESGETFMFHHNNASVRIHLVFRLRMETSLFKICLRWIF